MSFINNEELKKITNGSINIHVIDFAKNILILQLKPYIFDETQAKIIKEKIDNISILGLSIFAFKTGKKNSLTTLSYSNISASKFLICSSILFS